MCLKIEFIHLVRGSIAKLLVNFQNCKSKNKTSTYDTVLTLITNLKVYEIIHFAMLPKVIFIKLTLVKNQNIIYYIVARLK